MRSKTAGWVIAIVCLWLAFGCKTYDYEEEFFLEVDGSGELRLSGSLELLGFFHDLGEVTPESVVNHFDGPSLTSITVRESDRSGRPFIHITTRFSSFTELCQQTAFVARSCQLLDDGEELSIISTIPAPKHEPGGDIAPESLVAFRFHLPSQVTYHNSPSGVERGNILGWEQTFDGLRRQGALKLEARFGRRSVLSATVQILAMALLAVITVVVMAFALMIRKGRKQLAADQLLKARTETG